MRPAGGHRAVQPSSTARRTWSATTATQSARALRIAAATASGMSSSTKAAMSMQPVG
ncbi:hypothetical protein [Sphingomonas sp. BAUL-RG-20F-R05-02]|uniref:hypothetical protein n=1 Tax=Sphingomonas sp. BAUL-RG-20F-R05-02 TaxID=2914830 RepID=UPI001F56695A|nr:hypothetical protein [Sphingomonas sp. BAUL-RG-20F-R05-02]